LSRLSNSTDSVPFSPSARILPSASEPPFTLLERLYTPQEVAERLGVSERWVRDHATRRNPRIRVVKLGPLLRFREADVAAFIAAQTAPLSRRIRGNL
jgi:excisionase family DNA binding protein